eukprot:TRINITY_DN17604_c1_g1_i1.p2 TRINITY_DN17604_c1_g1~~TRINITY_DN17604_c1_g1_i1.p2  ORF type:complete len:119 (-),score=13.93 TRINITY_DN17604_c1_g1_i1:817-1173(-)
MPGVTTTLLLIARGPFHSPLAVQLLEPTAVQLRVVDGVRSLVKPGLAVSDTVGAGAMVRVAVSVTLPAGFAHSRRNGRAPTRAELTVASPLAARAPRQSPLAVQPSAPASARQRMVTG